MICLTGTCDDAWTMASHLATHLNYTMTLYSNSDWKLETKQKLDELTKVITSRRWPSLALWALESRRCTVVALSHFNTWKHILLFNPYRVHIWLPALSDSIFYGSHQVQFSVSVDKAFQTLQNAHAKLSWLIMSSIQDTWCKLQALTFSLGNIQCALYYSLDFIIQC